MFASSDFSSRSKTVQVYLTGDVIGVRATRIPPFWLSFCQLCDVTCTKRSIEQTGHELGREGQPANTKANSIPTFERLCFSLKGTQLNFVSIHNNFVNVSASGKLAWLFVADIIELNAQFKSVPRDHTPTDDCATWLSSRFCGNFFFLVFCSRPCLNSSLNSIIKDTC